MNSWFSELYLNKNKSKISSNHPHINTWTFENPLITVTRNNNVMMKNDKGKSKVCGKHISSDENDVSESSDESSEESEEDESSTYETSSNDEIDKDDKKYRRPLNNNDNKFKDCCQTGLLKVNNTSYSVLYKNNDENYNHHGRINSGSKFKGLPYLK